MHLDKNTQFVGAKQMKKEADRQADKNFNLNATGKEYIIHKEYSINVILNDMIKTEKTLVSECVTNDQ